MATGTTETRFDTPQAAEAAFYDAFISHNVDAMMAVWADDDDIACIHPLGTVQTGRTAIRESWEIIFRNTPQIKIIINERARTRQNAIAVHVVEEHIHIKGQESRPPVLATNTYRLTDAGWRIVLHHASPSPAKQERQTLH